MIIENITRLSVVLTLFGFASMQSPEIVQRASSLKTKSKPAYIVFSPDGKVLASAQNDSSTLQLWDTQTGTLRATLKGRSQPIVRNVFPTFSPDGRLLVVCDMAAKEVHVWEVETRKLDVSIKTSPIMGRPVFNSDGKVLAVLRNPGLGLWDVPARQLKKWNHSEAASVDALAFEPDGKAFWVSVASSDKSKVRFGLSRVSLVSGAVILKVDPAEGFPFEFALSPDGQTLVTTESDGLIFSRDGRMLSRPSDRDRTYKLLKAETGELIATFGSHKRGVPLIAFSANGKTLITSADEKRINLWDRDSAKLIVALEQKPGEFPRFSPDGNLLGLIAGHGLALHDARTGELKEVVADAGAPFAFSPDGNLLAAAHKDGTVSLWRILHR